MNAKSPWYRIQAAGERAVIFLYGDIGEGAITADGFVNELAGVEASTLELRINSPGGDLFAGIAIYNALRRHPARVRAHVDGLAASVASAILMAADRIFMPENARIMIHDPWTMVAGNVADLDKARNALESARESLIGIYQSRTGLPRKRIVDLMGAETWFTAAEAVKLRFADEIEQSISIAAHFDLSRFQNPPEHLTMTDKTATPPADTKPDKKTTMHAVTETEILARERTRRQEIRNLALPFARQGNDAIRALIDRCLDDSSITPEAASRLLLDELGRGASPINPHGASPADRAVYAHHAGYPFEVTGYGGYGRGDYLAACTDALLIRNRVLVKEAHPAAADLSRTSIVAMAEAICRQHGKDTKGMSPARILQAAHTTSDFPELLSNTAGKALMAGFENEPASHRQWVHFVDVPDFKEQSRTRLSEAPDLLQVNEHGEFQHGSFGERAEKYRLVTYGRIFGISRQALVNDDLAEFTRVPQAFGQAGRRKEADVVYNIVTSNPAMADGDALFHANHKNLAASGSALSLVSLGAARAAMRKQVGTQGGILNVVPRHLIVPAELETTAEELIASTVNPARSNDTENLEWIRRLELVVEPRLDADSTTAWYLAASFMQADTIEAAYLDGQRGVFIEEQQGFEVAGLKLKATLDFAAAAIDWVGLYKNPGA